MFPFTIDILIILLYTSCKRLRKRLLIKPKSIWAIIYNPERRKIMFKKRLFGSMSLLLILIFTASCAGVAETQTPENIQPGLQPTVISTPAPPEMEKTKITMWLFPVAGADDNAFYQPVIEEYTKAHPNIDIEIQWIPGEKRMELYLTAITGGASPDVFLMNSDTFATFADSNALLNLSEYWDQNELADFYENVIKDSSWKGALYMIPTDVSSTPIIYNKDMFIAAGLDPEKPPTTWDEFLSDCEVLTIDDKGHHFGEPDFNSEKVIQWCTSTPLATSFLAFKWNPWYFQAGGEYFNEDGTKVLFDSQAGLDAMNMVLKLADNFMPPSDKSAQYGADIDNFAQKRVAMIPCIENYVAGIYSSENPDLNFGVGPVLKYKVQASHGAATGYSISATTKNPEAVAEWLKFLTSSETLAKYSLYVGSPPSRASTAKAIADQVPPWLAFGMEQVKYSRSVAHPKIEVIWEIMAKEEEAVVMHLKTPEQALKDATEAINAALASD